MHGSVPDQPGRVVGLDGVRGLAALYVLLFHCWLLTFHGFPANTGPAWLGWLRYGHLAVVVFITLSGFSLAIAPARHGWRLGRLDRYASRRAWRILPPYWAALGFSLWTVTPQPHSGPPTGRSVLVYGLLVQDLIRAPVPNGAFWSIAVEAELYLILPLLLVIRRRWGALAMLAAVTVPVVAFGLTDPNRSTVDRLTWLTPQFAPLFAMGVAAAGSTTADASGRRRRWAWLAGLAAVPVVGVMLVSGTAWTVHHYFWVDLATGPAIALLLAAVAGGRPAGLVRWLDSRPVRRLGTISYSLYLVHVPIVVAVSHMTATHRFTPGLPTFWATVALAVPLSLTSAWLFAAAFELPFLHHRSLAALVSAVRGQARSRSDPPAAGTPG
jgi:peptidoglycan/LPS O-acetylase OafA/YrhL